MPRRFGLQHRIRVVQYNRRTRAWLVAVAYAIVLVTVLIAFALGSNYGARRASMPASTYAFNDSSLAKERLRSRSLEQQVANLQKGTEVDRTAAALLRNEIADARAEVLRLSREMEIYKSLLDGAAPAKGLVMHSFEIQSIDARHYSFRLTLLQRATKHARVQGTAWINILGEMGARHYQISHRELLPGPNKGAGLTLDMVYFQILDGQFELPPHFLPKTVRVTAIIKGRNSQRLDKAVAWAGEVQ
jgi:hypothetical protein